MERDSQALREDLYRVVQHYAELSRLAKKGAVDPVGEIGKILKRTAPYLLLVIRDLLPPLERGEMTYHEAIFHIIRAAQQFPEHQILIDSRNEIQKVEEAGRVFFFAVKWLDSPSNQRPSPQELELVRKKLADLNEKCRQRYAPADQESTALIPSSFVRQESESYETTVARMADLVRRAILELHHLMVEYEPEKAFLFFSRNSRKEIEDDIMHLAWFLFRCGYTVDRIASGYFKELLADFLNQKLLDFLINTQKDLDALQGVSNHLATISLIDFGSFFEIPSDYCDVDDSADVAANVKLMRSKNRRGWDLLKRISDLHKLYSAHPQGRVADGLLLYRYYSAFGDYHGEHRKVDPRAAQAVKYYKPRLDRANMEKQAEEDIQQSGRSFSSKTREEMAGLVKLIMDSLYDPAKVKGKKVKVLGDISSGAMGKVSIGIFKDRIVALKRVKAQISPTLGDPAALLEYEGALHARVQTPDQHPYVVEYYGLIEQNGDKLLVNGYHPNDNLTQLVERNWTEKYKPPFSAQSKLTLATMEILVNQLLECLRVFRQRGVVHRDLKTDNILYMVDENEMLNQIKVIDFGVALAIGPGAVEDLFRGKVVGTFAYMAPEQARGRSVFQSDLYSVGAIFTVLLTGKLPMIFPKAKNRQELVKQIMRIEQEPRPKLTTLNPWLAKNTVLEHMAATVESMLELDPMTRPNVDEVQSAFDGFFQHVGNEKHAISVFYHKG
ncbi:MAG: protein kinase [Desulfomonile tiedjei]|nr:protein kinase [Desulfomonile tiedjei]